MYSVFDVEALLKQGYDLNKDPMLCHEVCKRALSPLQESDLPTVSSCQTPLAYLASPAEIRYHRFQH